MTTSLDFYNHKRVLITGHTGFKGSWLCHILAGAGAVVTGYALEPPTEPSLFDIAHIAGEVDSHVGDIRDYEALKTVFDTARPEIVIHMAAQPIVREGYARPRETYEINVLGTVNVLECARMSDSVRSVLNVTTDKVYRNNEWPWGYRETDALDGADPYSNSKSCSDLVTHSYRTSFLDAAGIAVSVARAGNVIGGGDFAVDRIIPDCARAAAAGRTVYVRNPHSVRPYQHVLEPLMAYLMIAQGQYDHPELADCYNVGPDDSDCVETGKLVELFCDKWGDGAAWEARPEEGAPHESNILKLDCSRIKSVYGWQPRWHIDEAVALSVEWYRAWSEQQDVREVMDREIGVFLA